MRPFARLLAALLVAAVACGGPLPSPRPAPHEPALPEPSAAAAFVDAHARDDPGRLAGALSPLHGVEGARRGRAPGLDPLWASAVPLVDLAYVGTLRGVGGFAHAIYSARPRRGGPPTTVWRVDLDPAGRVVWAEPVRLLDVDRVQQWVSDDSIAVEAADGAGYRAEALADGAAPGRAAAVRFLILSADGTATPDPWTFLLPFALVDGEGHRALAPPLCPCDPRLPADERTALAAYLRATAIPPSRPAARN